MRDAIQGKAVEHWFWRLRLCLLWLLAFEEGETVAAGSGTGRVEDAGVGGGEGAVCGAVGEADACSHHLGFAARAVA